MKKSNKRTRQFSVIPTFSVTGDTMVIILQAENITKMTTKEIGDALRDYAELLEIDHENLN